MDDLIITAGVVNIYHGRGKPRWAVHVVGPVSEQAFPQFPVGAPMLVVLTNTQKVDLTYGVPVDAKGDPAAVDNVVWKSSDPATATVAAGATPYTGTVKAVHTGACQVWIEADADLGDGVTLITGDKVDVQITGGQAVGFGPPTVGVPSEQ
jgi:hypothetical protein